MTIELRPYQKEAIESAIECFKKNENALVCLATGTGKSLIVAGLIDKMKQYKPAGRCLMLVHSSQLVKQNREKMELYNKDIKVATYSAGLKEKRLDADIIYATIQSIIKVDPNKLGWFDMLIIDEVHLINMKNGNTMYNKIISNLKVINPKLRICGLTATPFRMDTGLLTDGDNKIFNYICYNYGIKEGVEQGYLTPLVSKISKEVLDLSGIKVRNHDYALEELEAVMSAEEKVKSTVSEALELSSERHSLLWFCSGLKHVDMIVKELEKHNRKVASIVGSDSQDKRNKIIEQYNNREITDVVSADCLTTGFDAPITDCIVALRPTKSAGLFIQIAGRGTRLFKGKDNCLFLDFANLIQTHGSVNDIKIKTKLNRKTNKMETQITKTINKTKICPECLTVLDKGEKVCPHCFYEFPVEEVVKHNIVPETELDIMDFKLKDKVKIVKSVVYTKYLASKWLSLPEEEKQKHYCIKCIYVTDDNNTYYHFLQSYKLKDFIYNAIDNNNLKFYDWVFNSQYKTSDVFIKKCSLDDFIYCSSRFFLKPTEITIKRNEDGYNSVTSISYKKNKENA